MLHRPSHDKTTVVPYAKFSDLAITSQQLGWEQKEISIEFELRWKIVREMGPWIILPIFFSVIPQAGTKTNITAPLPRPTPRGETVKYVTWQIRINNSHESEKKQYPKWNKTKHNKTLCLFYWTYPVIEHQCSQQNFPNTVSFIVIYI